MLIRFFNDVSNLEKILVADIFAQLHTDKNKLFQTHQISQ